MLLSLYTSALYMHNVYIENDFIKSTFISVLKKTWQNTYEAARNYRRGLYRHLLKEIVTDTFTHSFFFKWTYQLRSPLNYVDNFNVGIEKYPFICIFFQFVRFLCITSNNQPFEINFINILKILLCRSCFQQFNINECNT